MNALQEAKQEMAGAENLGYENGQDKLRFVMAYAAIAQAESLERIADALDILAHPNRLVAPDPQDYFSEDDYNDAAEKFDYHKHSLRGESMDEYKARRDGAPRGFPAHEPHPEGSRPSPLDNF